MLLNSDKRLVFLCSGGGGNLAFIHQAIEHGWLPRSRIVAVLTDRLCQANKFAERMGLLQRCIDFNEEGQHSLLIALDELQPDLIITTVNKILGAAIVERYRGRLINLHYSLLPSFGGLIGTHPVQAALDYHALFNGVTVHLVNEHVDAGKPLVQGVIALQQGDEIDRLMPIVFKSGCIALLSAIRNLLHGSVAPRPSFGLKLEGRDCLFNGGDDEIPRELTKNKSFWLQLHQSLNLDV